MRIQARNRLQFVFLSISTITTVIVLQKLWNESDCDRLCRVMKENQNLMKIIEPDTSRDNSSTSSSSSSSSSTSSLSYLMTDVKTSHETSIQSNGITIEQDSFSLPFPFRPFEAKQPKLIVILTYQRCGSTFFANMFNQNPEAFYMFEPLDSLYSSLYGTKPGWNVPSDITSFQNGSQRLIPTDELQSVFEFLKTLFTCQINALPTETLIHPYIYDYFSKEFFVNKDYVSCVRRLRSRILRCVQLVPWAFCGGRFGEVSEETQRECRRIMTDNDYRKQHRHWKLFGDYVSCLTDLRQNVDRLCSSFMVSACQTRQLRVIKLVRATMDSMEPLLNTYPNLRVIQLIRDPRAVVLSRLNFHSSARGLYAENNKAHVLTHEAILYCRTVVNDVRTRQRLDKKYPGKIYSIIYEDFVKDLEVVTKNVYRFINASMPVTWMRQITSNEMKRNATDRAKKWQTQLPTKVNSEILTTCDDFFRTIKYDWPNARNVL